MDREADPNDGGAPGKFPRIRFENHVALISVCAAVATAVFAYLQVDVAKRTWRDQTLLTQQVQSCGAIMKAVRVYAGVVDNASPDIRAAVAHPAGAVNAAALQKQMGAATEQLVDELDAEDVFFDAKVRADLAGLRDEARQIQIVTTNALRSGDAKTFSTVDRHSAALRNRWGMVRNACHLIAFPGDR